MCIPRAGAFDLELSEVGQQPPPYSGSGLYYDALVETNDGCTGHLAIELTPDPRSGQYLVRRTFAVAGDCPAQADQPQLQECADVWDAQLE